MIEYVIALSISYAHYHVAKIGRGYKQTVIQITGRKTNFPAIELEKKVSIILTDSTNQ